MGAATTGIRTLSVHVAEGSNAYASATKSKLGFGVRATLARRSEAVQRCGTNTTRRTPGGGLWNTTVGHAIWVFPRGARVRVHVGRTCGVPRNTTVGLSRAAAAAVVRIPRLPHGEARDGAARAHAPRAHEHAWREGAGATPRIASWEDTRIANRMLV